MIKLLKKYRAKKEKARVEKVKQEFRAGHMPSEAEAAMAAYNFYGNNTVKKQVFMAAYEWFKTYENPNS